MKKLKYADMDIYITSPGKYAMKYAGETFNFASWQDIVQWIHHVRAHEKASGFVRDNGVLAKKTEDDNGNS